MIPELFIEQLTLAQRLARQLVDPNDVVLEVNNGAGAGQIVFHSHMHFRSGSQWKIESAAVSSVVNEGKAEK